MKDIKTKDWKYLLRGLQEKFQLNQEELIKKINLKVRQSHFSMWINNRSIPSKQNKNKIIKFTLVNKLNIREIIKLGKGTRVGNNIIFLEDCIAREDIKEKIFLIEGEKIFINTTMLFPIRRNNNKIYFIPNNDYLTIFYPEKRSSKPEPIKPAKLIEITPKLLVRYGLYLTEGAKNRHPKITNSEPIIINEGIKFFKHLGYQKSKLSAWIQLHERSKKPLKVVRNFWVNKTKLNSKQIKKLRIKKSVGNAPVQQYGTLHLEAQSILLRILIAKLIELYPQIIKHISKEQYKYLLQGFFAGDGSIELTKKKTVKEINFTNTNEELCNSIAKILDNLNINYKVEEKRKQIRIYGYKNFRILNKLNIFKYHPKRKCKLKIGIKNGKHIKNH